jgi:golgi phosphoprotein 3
MLTFPEEIVLLLLDDETGALNPLPQSVFSIVLAGAGLMDLAIRNRVDTDLDGLTIVDRTPLGDGILDDLLVRVAAAADRAAGRLDITEALYEGAQRAEQYQSQALRRLVAGGILREESGRHLWVFRARRYPIVDDSEQQEVQSRLRQLLMSDDIPDPRDIVLVCLVDACGLMRFVLSPDEIKATEPRVRQLRKMDLIGQAVVRGASEVQEIIRFATTTY